MNAPDPREVALQTLIRQEAWGLVRQGLQARVDALQLDVITRRYDSDEALRLANRDQAQLVLLEELLADPVKMLLDTDQRKDARPLVMRRGAGVRTITRG